MVWHNVFGLKTSTSESAAQPRSVARIAGAMGRQLARIWCATSGHYVMLHFEPNKLSLQCAFCGYETRGWEVGRPMTARRQTNNPQARPDRRSSSRPLSTNARLAS